MSGPAVGLWLFEPRGFADILADVVPCLEAFCHPVEANAGGDVDFWVRDGSVLGLRSFDPAGVDVFFLSEDEEMPAEDEDCSAFARPPVQGLVVGAGCSGSVNHTRNWPSSPAARSLLRACSTIRGDRSRR